MEVRGADLPHGWKSMYNHHWWAWTLNNTGLNCMGQLKKKIHLKVDLQSLNLCCSSLNCILWGSSPFPHLFYLWWGLPVFVDPEITSKSSEGVCKVQTNLNGVWCVTWMEHIWLNGRMDFLSPYSSSIVTLSPLCVCCGIKHLSFYGIC